MLMPLDNFDEDYKEKNFVRGHKFLAPQNVLAPPELIVWQQNVNICVFFVLEKDFGQYLVVRFIVVLKVILVNECKLTCVRYVL